MAWVPRCVQSCRSLPARARQPTRATCCTKTLAFARPPGTTKRGLIDLEGFDAPTDAQVYLCGPLPFMESFRHSLLARNVPERNMHYEVFGPETWLPDA